MHSPSYTALVQAKEMLVAAGASPQASVLGGATIAGFFAAGCRCGTDGVFGGGATRRTLVYMLAVAADCCAACPLAWCCLSRMVNHMDANHMDAGYLLACVRGM